MYRPSTIVEDIWVYTQKARLILADITGKNPNVFYELGLAHALAKPAILITETIDDVPFDLRSLRIIERDKNRPDWGATLRATICTSIRETLASPRSSVLPSFMRVETQSTPGVPRNEINNLRILDDLALLKEEVARIGSKLIQTPPVEAPFETPAGVSPHTADSTTQPLQTPAIHGMRNWRIAEGHAHTLLQQGYAPNEIVKALVSDGIDSASAKSIVESHVPGSRKKR